ncbi:hypothetical protein BCV70DRAFT_120538 [Testicularia cyperi]|uniref:Uncharacterized protein n=1 Tax=Testicularia cyperi TaxID=1882483 RepID=A0A317XMK4_9BASI|nr:hypothetical protein BCV70DRAFT_120538 [Testicularia cyperi]
MQDRRLLCDVQYSSVLYASAFSTLALTWLDGFHWPRFASRACQWSVKTTSPKEVAVFNQSLPATNPACSHPPSAVGSSFAAAVQKRALLSFFLFSLSLSLSLSIYIYIYAVRSSYTLASPGESFYKYKNNGSLLLAPTLFPVSVPLLPRSVNLIVFTTF